MLFGVVAVVLAPVGIYGMVSFSVNQRRQEFGVRMALGADQGRIITMVLKQGGWQLAVGLAAGFIIGFNSTTSTRTGTGLQPLGRRGDLRRLRKSRGIQVDHRRSGFTIGRVFYDAERPAVLLACAGARAQSAGDRTDHRRL